VPRASGASPISLPLAILRRRHPKESGRVKEQELPAVARRPEEIVKLLLGRLWRGISMSGRLGAEEISAKVGRVILGRLAGVEVPAVSRNPCALIEIPFLEERS